MIKDFLNSHAYRVSTKNLAGLISPLLLIVSLTIGAHLALGAETAVPGKQKLTRDPSGAGAFSVYVKDVRIDAAPEESARIYAPSLDHGKSMVAGGRYPLVIVLPGFLAHYTYYEQMTRHLVSWGFVVVGIDFAKPSDHIASAKQVQKTIDWALSPANPAHSIIDPDKIALAGHSLGGKIAVYASSGDANTKYPKLNFAGDPRIKLIIAWDPVDSGGPPCPIADGDLPGQCRGLPVLQGNIQRSRAKMLIFGGITSDPKRLTCTPAGRTHANFFANVTSQALHVEFPKSGHVDWVDQGTWFGVLPFLGNLLCGDLFSRELFSGDRPRADPLQVQAIAKRTQLIWLLKNFGDYEDLDQYLTGDVIRADCSKQDLCKVEARQ